MSDRFQVVPSNRRSDRFYVSDAKGFLPIMGTFSKAAAQKTADALNAAEGKPKDGCEGYRALAKLEQIEAKLLDAISDKSGDS